MSGIRTVTVDLGSRSYPIHIGAETLPVLGRELRTLVGATRAVVNPVDEEQMQADLDDAGRLLDED